MKFYIVDAFTREIFGGNPAGVVILPEGGDFPPDEICVKTAAELRYSETAFVKRQGEREFNIRYFTPAAEVDLCGHATIAAFTALSGSGIIGGGDYLLRTLSGDLNVSVEPSGILMDMAKPAKLGDIAEAVAIEELYGIMGLDWQKQLAAGLSLRPQVISTGLPDIMMPVASLDDLNDIAPDFPALSGLSERYEVTGVHAFTAECDDATFHTRNFAPLYDINEEAATGTSSGALTYYGYLNGLLKPGDNCTFIQGEKMGRPSMIISSFEKIDAYETKDSLRADEKGEYESVLETCGESEICETVKIRVGGSGAILAEGEINL